MEAYIKLMKNGKMLKKLSLFIAIILFIQSSTWAGVPQELKIDRILKKYKNGNATVADVLKATNLHINKLGSNYNEALKLLKKLKEYRISPNTTYMDSLIVQGQIWNCFGITGI
jgi:hypothetical protein